MPRHDSVSQWLDSLKAGETAQIGKLWDRYRNRLVEIASRRLAGIPKGLADEDDIAQSVFLSLCRGAVAGRLDDVKNRDELWWLLLAITKQKAVQLVRRGETVKRGGGHVYSESDCPSELGRAGAFSIDNLVGDCPTAETLAILEEESQRLLDLLPSSELAKVATHRIEGYSVAEIANELSVSKRSIERKLRLIRDVWSQELIRAG